MILIFFGAPGVGKGTQAALVSERQQIAHLSTGDAFRRAIVDNTELGTQAKKFLDAGELVPDEIVTRIVEEALMTNSFSAGAILDGFPRTVNQARELDTLLAKHGKQVTYVINIEVERNEIVRRMLARGRNDDTPELIQHRLDVYQESTAPLLHYYHKSGDVVRNIDGNADVESVYKQISTIFS